MRSLLTQDEIEDLLEFIGVDKIGVWKNGKKIQFCCPIHGETHPSCGINIEYMPEKSSQILQVFSCFSCGESGSIAKFLMLSMPDDFRTIFQAIQFINKRYNVDISLESRNTYNDDGSLNIRLKSYSEIKNKEVVRAELPLYKIAPFKSGKETYKYFYDRGFDKQAVKDFMIGRDLENKTVTVPIFWQDGILGGIIGRYINPNRPPNDRFKIYDFQTGDMLFPLDHFYTDDGEIILVEGLFDAIYLHMLGYHNTLTTFTNKITKKQIELLKSLGVKSIVDMLDNDERGREGYEVIKEKLGNKFLWKYVPFPDYGKDPRDWTEEEIHYMLAHKSIIRV